MSVALVLSMVWSEGNEGLRDYSAGNLNFVQPKAYQSLRKETTCSYILHLHFRRRRNSLLQGYINHYLQFYLVNAFNK